MSKSRSVRLVTTFLMLIALLLPVAPVGAQSVTDEGSSEVRAASVPGPVVPVTQLVLPASREAADCSNSLDGTSRFFASIQSTGGTDILNASGRMVTLGFPAQPQPQTVTFNNGDFESQASDGTVAGGCVPAVNDGHANDIATPFVNTFDPNSWTVIITAPGFTPRVFFPLPTDDTQGLGGGNNCGLGDGKGCLVSFGTIQLQPLAAPAGRGVVAGSVFQVNGQPLDGATIVLTDASGNVHTRTSGTDCNGVPIGSPLTAADDTGFFCFADSTPEPHPGAPNLAFSNDGLGLPVGPASIVIVNNGPQNCGVVPAPPAGPATIAGNACNFLPAFVQVNVVGGAVTGQDITMQNKFAPAAPATPGAGAFGYVVNGQGQGVGGVTVSATGGVSCQAGFDTRVTSTQTGLWSMCGLAANSAVTFTISGPGVLAANVRPALSITRGTGPNGTWADPNWVIIAPGPQAITIPMSGSAIIRGQILACQDPLPQPETPAASCVPFTGPGAFALLWRDSTRGFAGATMFNGPPPGSGAAGAGAFFFPAQGWPSIVPQTNIPVQPFTSGPAIIAAAPIDAGGNYCFGAATNPVGIPPTSPGLCIGQPPLIPDTYFVTIVDDRPNSTCTPGFQPAPGGIGPVPCGHMMQTSQPVVALTDRITTVNFALQPRFSPGSPTIDPGFVAGSAGVFGFVRDAGVPGGRPIQGVTVYAVPVPPAIAGIIAAGLVPGASAATANAGAAALGNFVATVQISGPGILAGGILSSTPPPIVGGGVGPPYPGTGPFGLYRIIGLVPGTAYAVIVEPPQSYNGCAPNNTTVGVPTLGFPGNLSPANIVRCSVFVTAPATAGLWATGADFAMSPQSLEPVEPGEVDRRLEHIIPIVSNGAPTAALGGWELQTTEIHVTNAGPLRTVAEVRFYASDGIGGAGVLAGTQTADIVPGGGRVFRAPEMPGGFLGWVGIWSFDADGPQGIYGASSLVAISKLIVRNAGNALTIMPGVSREEITSPGQHIEMPLAYKRYGGTANKWSSIITAVNIGESAPVIFQFKSQDRVRGDARACRTSCLITRYANRGSVIVLNLGDETDPDLALLGDGTYVVDIQAGGSMQPSSFAGELPGQFRTTYPGGYIFTAIHVTAEGRMATNGRSQDRLGASGGQGHMGNENTGPMYAPLLFKNYNGWSSGMVLSSSQTSGGQSAVATVTFYNEDGGFVGEVNDRLSSSGAAWYIYLPELEFLPDKYRGTAVINFGSSGGDLPGFGPGISMAGYVQHVNYDRNHAMSYDAIGASAVANRLEAVGELPCISVGFMSCAWAGEIQKTATVSRSEIAVGIQTGVRLMNADPFHTGVPATVVVHYIDDTGVIWNDATQVFTINVHGIHTLFPLYDARLPEVFRGSMRISSSGNYVVGVANTVDYGIMGSDASGAFNLQYHTGRTR